MSAVHGHRLTRVPDGFIRATAESTRPLGEARSKDRPDIARTLCSVRRAIQCDIDRSIDLAPGRDACGGHSGGGAGSVGAYRTWIASFAAAIGTKPAVVVIEPDALGDFACMSSTQIQERLDMLRYATEKFREKAPNTSAYLDGGNAGWVAPAAMASRLNSAGVHNIRGFSVNVSNYYSTGASVSYASSVNSELGGGAGFVVDTSRNGNGKGSSGEWCNPAGRKLGTPPQTGGGADMLLWIKTPGNSDGQCGIAPTVPAGVFSPDIAVRLIDGV